MFGATEICGIYNAGTCGRKMMEWFVISFLFSRMQTLVLLSVLHNSISGACEIEIYAYVHLCICTYVRNAHTKPHLLTKAFPHGGMRDYLSYSLDLMKIIIHARRMTLAHSHRSKEVTGTLNSLLCSLTLLQPASSFQTLTKSQCVTFWYCKERVMMWQTKSHVIKTNWETLRMEDIHQRKLRKSVYLL